MPACRVYDPVIPFFVEFKYQRLAVKVNMELVDVTKAYEFSFYFVVLAIMRNGQLESFAHFGCKYKGNSVKE